MFQLDWCYWRSLLCRRDRNPDQIAALEPRLRCCKLERMNKLQAIFDSLPDAELKAVVVDLQRQNETGVLPKGPARELARRVVTEVGVPFSDASQIVRTEPIRRAAFKWATT